MVVSPLIALMQDQVDGLRKNGIPATFLNSSVSFDKVRAREQAILAGKIKLLYVAPERLLSERFLPLLDLVHNQIGISAFAIDEAEIPIFSSQIREAVAFQKASLKGCLVSKSGDSRGKTCWGDYKKLGDEIRNEFGE